MDHHLTTAALAELTAAQTTPCLSLYQSTHRHAPDNHQDGIRFGNLIKKLEASLLQQHTQAQAQELLKPFKALADDKEFWNHTLDGLAVLAAPYFFRVFRLQRDVPELAIVADSFHTKPLRRFLQSIDRYQVLALSRSGFRFFEGNRNSLDEINLASAMPTTVTDALGDEVTEPRHTVSSHAGVGSPGSDDIAQVAEAAANGRITTLMIESGRQLPGHLDTKTGAIDRAELSNPEVDDLLDDLGELVEAMGGKVCVMPAERMPGSSGVAATFRY